VRYIEEAKGFLEEAREEFEKGKEQDNIFLIRDACEKGWNAIVQALNALFVKKGISPLPRSHRERRIKIRELEMADERVRDKGFFDRFMARDHILHERGFCDGDVIIEEIESEFEKVESFIKDVEEF